MLPPVRCKTSGLKFDGCVDRSRLAYTRRMLVVERAEVSRQIEDLRKRAEGGAVVSITKNRRALFTLATSQPKTQGKRMPEPIRAVDGGYAGELDALLEERESGR